MTTNEEKQLQLDALNKEVVAEIYADVKSLILDKMPGKGNFPTPPFLMSNFNEVFISICGGTPFMQEVDAVIAEVLDNHPKVWEVVAEIGKIAPKEFIEMYEGKTDFGMGREMLTGPIIGTLALDMIMKEVNYNTAPLLRELDKESAKAQADFVVGLAKDSIALFSQEQHEVVAAEGMFELIEAYEESENAEDDFRGHELAGIYHNQLSKLFNSQGVGFYEFLNTLVEVRVETMNPFEAMVTSAEESFHFDTMVSFLLGIQDDCSQLVKSVGKEKAVIEVEKLTSLDEVFSLMKKYSKRM